MHYNTLYCIIDSYIIMVDRQNSSLSCPSAVNHTIFKVNVHMVIIYNTILWLPRNPYTEHLSTKHSYTSQYILYYTCTCVSIVFVAYKIGKRKKMIYNYNLTFCVTIIIIILKSTIGRVIRPPSNLGKGIGHGYMI